MYHGRKEGDGAHRKNKIAQQHKSCKYQHPEISRKVGTFAPIYTDIHRALGPPSSPGTTDLQLELPGLCEEAVRGGSGRDVEAIRRDAH